MAVKSLIIAFLMSGLIGVSASHYKWKVKAKNFQTETKELQIKNEALKSLLDNCVKDRAEKLADFSEENFIPWPGRLFAREVDLHDLISIFLEDSDRICFGKGWELN